jgi:hypothetical protein
MGKLLAVWGLAIIGFVALVPSGAKALTLSPPRLEFGIEPGSDLTSKVRVINESQETVTLYPSTANFTAKDESGNPYFLFDERGGLASWIDIAPGPFVLLAGERQDIPFSINVPKAAEAGGYYAGIFFSPTPPKTGGQEGGQVAVVSKLGTLVLLRVAGDVSIVTKVLEFHVADDQRVFTRLPVQFWYRLRNSSKVHILPLGVVKLKNMLGLTSAEPTANPVEGAVLSNSTRRFEPVWQRNEQPEVVYRNGWQYFWAETWAEARNFAFGRYTAQLMLSNVPGTETVAKVSFWVLPWHFLLVTVVGLLLVWWVLKSGIGRYNRWIIKRAGAR